MACKSCGFSNQNSLIAEMGLHIPGLKNLDRPVVWLFPKILVCVNCGFSEFFVPEDKLPFLEAEQRSAALGSRSQ